MNAISTQLRDPINSGLTRWRMAVLNKAMDATAELGRTPQVSTKFSLSMETSRTTQDGTAKPFSRDQIFRRKRGQGKKHFSCSADHEQDWQLYPVDPYSAESPGHIYTHTHIYIYIYIIYISL